MSRVLIVGSSFRKRNRSVRELGRTSATYPQIHHRYKKKYYNFFVINRYYQPTMVPLKTIVVRDKGLSETLHGTSLVGSNRIGGGSPLMDI